MYGISAIISYPKFILPHAIISRKDPIDSMQLPRRKLTMKASRSPLKPALPSYQNLVPRAQIVAEMEVEGGVPDMGDDELVCMLSEGDLDGDGALKSDGVLHSHVQIESWFDGRTQAVGGGDVHMKQKMEALGF
ncbi:hypothetical protein CK203_114399 [Vitis vinifera]|uniref:Uncharacterized protein n=1 Tax=Vitis vinifera TaxID=29760 RepID=A0A438FDD3_VITVI|nr:hypothetical protein CK203_114399 [Vitis vinifera]